MSFSTARLTAFLLSKQKKQTKTKREGQIKIVSVRGGLEGQKRTKMDVEPQLGGRDGKDKEREQKRGMIRGVQGTQEG